MQSLSVRSLFFRRVVEGAFPLVFLFLLLPFRRCFFGGLFCEDSSSVLFVFAACSFF